MKAESYNKEQIYSEFFNLRRRKKELNDRKIIKYVQPKKYFARTRDLLQGEMEDIEAVADCLGYKDRSQPK
jgi:hypothetical protein